MSAASTMLSRSACPASSAVNIGACMRLFGEPHAGGEMGAVVWGSVWLGSVRRPTNRQSANTPVTLRMNQRFDVWACAARFGRT